MSAEPNICVTGSCLTHRKRVFQQSGGPDAELWCHLDGRPCQPVIDMGYLSLPAELQQAIEQQLVARRVELRCAWPPASARCPKTADGKHWPIELTSTHSTETVCWACTACEQIIATPESVQS